METAAVLIPLSNKEIQMIVQALHYARQQKVWRMTKRQKDRSVELSERLLDESQGLR